MRMGIAYCVLRARCVFVRPLPGASASERGPIRLRARARARPEVRHEKNSPTSRHEMLWIDCLYPTITHEFWCGMICGFCRINCGMGRFAVARHNLDGRWKITRRKTGGSRASRSTGRAEVRHASAFFSHSGLQAWNV